MSERRRVFVSYSHEDKKWLERLQVHLDELDREGLIDLWDDTRIKAGADWAKEIEEAIASAAAAILLVSADFLASDFIVRKEIPPLLAARAEGALVIPVIVGPCRFTRHPQLKQFQAINDPDTPLSALSAHDAEAKLRDLANRVEDATRELPTGQPASSRTGSETTGLKSQLTESLITLHVLQTAANAPEGMAVTGYYDLLGLGSRKALVAAIEALSAEGWIERDRRDGQTLWSITSEGRDQLTRFSKLAKVRLDLGEPGE